MEVSPVMPNCPFTPTKEEIIMAQITLQGNPINTAGNLPAVNTKAPSFTLTKTDLSDCTLQDYAGKTRCPQHLPQH